MSEDNFNNLDNEQIYGNESEFSEEDLREEGVWSGSRSGDVRLEKFPDTTGTSFQLDESALQKYFDLWNREPLLIVSTRYDQFSRFIAQRLMLHSEASSGNAYKKEIDFHSVAQLGVYKITDIVKSTLWESGDRLALILKNEAASLLQNILYDSGSLIMLLRKLEKQLLIIINEDELDLLNHRRPGEQFDGNLKLWREDYLIALLTKDYPKEAKHLHTLLLKQKKCGYWGSDIDFHRSVREAYGRTRLKEEIEEVDKDAVYDGIRPDQRTDDLEAYANELLNKGEFEKTILFVASFFPNLSFEEFTEVVIVLMPKKSQKRMLKKTIISKKGKKREVSVKKKSSYIEMWSNDQDRIMKELCLCIWEKDGGEEAVTFAKGRLSYRLEKIFLRERRGFLNQMFKYIFDENIYLKLIKYDRVRNKTFKLMITMSLRNPHYFGRDLMRGVIEKIFDQISGEMKTQNDCGPLTQQEILSKVLHCYHENIYFIGDLIQKMHEHQRLINMVDDFFNDLLNAPEHTFNLFALIYYLSNLKTLNFMEWFKRFADKRLLNEMESMKSDLILYFLIEVSREEPSNYHEVIIDIAHWLPDSMKKYDAQVSSEQCAMRFVLRVLLYDSRRVKLGGRDFMWHVEKKGHYEKTVPIVLKTMCHPSMCHYLDGYIPDLMFFTLVNSKILENVRKEFIGVLQFHFWNTLIKEANDELTRYKIEDNSVLKSMLFVSVMLFDWSVRLNGSRTTEDNINHKKMFELVINELDNLIGDNEQQRRTLRIVWKCMISVFNKMRIWFRGQTGIGRNNRKKTRDIDRAICVQRRGAKLLIDALKRNRSQTESSEPLEVK